MAIFGGSNLSGFRADVWALNLPTPVVPTLTPTAANTPAPPRVTPPTSTPAPTQLPTQGPSPVVIGVQPSSGVNTSLTGVRIDGTNFRSGARVDLVGSAGAYSLNDPSVVDASTILAEVPTGIPGGVYDVVVTNSDGTQGRLSRGFTVTSTDPAPTGIRPNVGSASIPTDVVVDGFNFREGISVTLALSGTVQPLVNLVRLGSTRLRAVVPAGTAAGVYDVVLRNAGATGAGRLSGAFTVLSADNDDFFIGEDDIWTSPVAVRSGETVQIGVNLHRRGGKATVQVPVRFYLGDPNAGGILIGERTTDPIVPRTEIDSSAVVSWATGSRVGSVTLYAVVDPGNTVAESTKANNTASRSITILAASAEKGDKTPPVISGLSINNDAGQTTSTGVSVAVTASDPSPGTGVARMYLVEKEFNSAARSWVSVQNTGWVTYTSPYALTLMDKAGIRYIQGWVADGAGNISLQAYKKRIDYVPPTDSLLQNQVRLYRRTLAVGETLTVRVAPTSGDADLYIWDPDANAAAIKNADGLAVDEATITATKAGVYQIEVFGYSDTTYRIAIASGRSAVVAAGKSAVTPNASKPTPTAPTVSADNEPEGTTAAPSAPVGSTNTNSHTYLPVVLDAYLPGW